MFSRTSPVTFRDRQDAGFQVAQLLRNYKEKHPLILAIPRGGIIIGEEVADLLQTQLDVILVGKLSSPHDSECAIGAVSENGEVFLADYAYRVGATVQYIENAKQKTLEKLKHYRFSMTSRQNLVNPEGRCVIIVDDGVATGTLH